MKVMDERPHNVVDVFEDLSLDVKMGLYEDKQSTLRDSPKIEGAEVLADQQCLLFSEESYFQYEQVLATYTLQSKYVMEGKAFLWTTATVFIQSCVNIIRLSDLCPGPLGLSHWACVHCHLF